jgi:hypothetical protein
MRKLKEMQIKPGTGKHSTARLHEDQKRLLMALGGKELSDKIPGLGQGDSSMPLNDDSINFSNLESSINPSMYNESTNHKNNREKQLLKL